MGLPITNWCDVNVLWKSVIWNLTRYIHIGTILYIMFIIHQAQKNLFNSYHESKVQDSIQIIESVARKKINANFTFGAQ